MTETDPCCSPAPPGDSLPMAEACCPPPGSTALAMAEPCCGSAAEAVGPRWADRERPGYRIWPFVDEWIETPVGDVPVVSTRLGKGDVLGRWAMRWGIGRDRYRIAPGLYAVGRPTPDSPVVVTANYKMTFDLVRKDLGGVNAWILVLETWGINVWCAAGKGTFGTDELVARVRKAGLDRVVSHRTLVVPQLGATGVAAHEVRRRCGFRVVYGPVRSRDLAAFLRAGMKASPNMRRVTFSLWERLVLTPVELRVILMRPSLALAALLLVLGGIGPGGYSLAGALVRGGAAVGTLAAGVLAGAVAAPVLLPWLPGRMFAVKGVWTGLGAALVLAARFGTRLNGWGLMALVLAVTAASSYCAMNFTGSTPFTSPSGVEAEMRRALPWQIGAAGLALVAWMVSAWSL
ncbi:mercury methylation corrinoid protein HgcA [Deferrisoma camini]|uniref:mercury methylation corrinoid protein HgcA n=1 Tax=Deferrisoma camini TaxID=1035120 RepID=UPI0004B22D94|nr:mercury methylation corrinoid protein HgcA [Deferrisoma camini]